jgi:hypothetical protein
MGAAATIFLGVLDPNVLETLACREALAQAEDLDVRQVGITSDFLGVIRDLKVLTHLLFERSMSIHSGLLMFLSFMNEGNI